jgi:hypothetical protein
MSPQTWTAKNNMRPFVKPSDRRTIWIPKMPQDMDASPPPPNPAGTLLVPDLSGVTFQAAAAGTRIIPSATNGL